MTGADAKSIPGFLGKAVKAIRRRLKLGIQFYKPRRLGEWIKISSGRFPRRSAGGGCARFAHSSSSSLYDGPGFSSFNHTRFFGHRARPRHLAHRIAMIQRIVAHVSVEVQIRPIPDGIGL